MKNLLLMMVLLLIVASPAIAQNGQLEVYSDPNYVDCFFVDETASVVSVYVVHRFPAGASGVHFRVEATDGFTCDLALVTYSGYAVGTPESGVGVSYGMCANSDRLVATLTYNCLGTSAHCSTLSIVADPNYPSGQLVAADCAAIPGQSTIAGGVLYINRTGNCGCTVPLRETTWGQIKALYTD